MLKQSPQNILFYLNLVLVLKLQNVFIQSLFLLHSLKLAVNIGESDKKMLVTLKVWGKV